MAKALLLVLCCFSSYFCLGQQYVGHHTLSTKFKAITLTDIATGNRFLLDSTRIVVTALNPQGKQLWRTDAWKDNHLEAYRVTRPVISYFAFGKDDSAKRKEVIWLTYNNTQFGFLDKKTGAFTWLGQD
jgi:glucose dehydrogenase